MGNTSPDEAYCGDLVETLREVRASIESLDVSDGEFVVACRDTGIRPEPVTDAEFERYGDAERACEEARRYREAMREMDPDLTRYNLVVSSVDEAGVDVACVRQQTGQRRENGLPSSRRTVTVAGSGSEEWLRVENGPIVHFTGPDSLLDDKFVTHQLDAGLPDQR